MINLQGFKAVQTRLSPPRASLTCVSRERESGKDSELKIAWHASLETKTPLKHSARPALSPHFMVSNSHKQMRGNLDVHKAAQAVVIGKGKRFVSVARKQV